jgi:hypothetical protein
VASKAAIGLRVTVSAATKVKESRRGAERLPRRLWARGTKNGSARHLWGSRVAGRADEEAP